MQLQPLQHNCELDYPSTCSFMRHHQAEFSSNKTMNIVYGHAISMYKDCTSAYVMIQTFMTLWNAVDDKNRLLSVLFTSSSVLHVLDCTIVDIPQKRGTYIESLGWQCLHEPSYLVLGICILITYQLRKIKVTFVYSLATRLTCTMFIV